VHKRISRHLSGLELVGPSVRTGMGDATLKRSLAVGFPVGNRIGIDLAPFSDFFRFESERYRFRVASIHRKRVLITISDLFLSCL